MLPRLRNQTKLLVGVPGIPADNNELYLKGCVPSYIHFGRYPLEG